MFFVLWQGSRIWRWVLSEQNNSNVQLSCSVLIHNVSISPPLWPAGVWDHEVVRECASEVTQFDILIIAGRSEISGANIQFISWSGPLLWRPRLQYVKWCWTMFQLSRGWPDTRRHINMSRMSTAVRLDNTRRGASLTLHHDITEVSRAMWERTGARAGVETLPACKLLLSQF